MGELVQYLGESSGRGFSPAIWGPLDQLSIRYGTEGFDWSDQFLHYVAGGMYTATAAVTGTAALLAGDEGGFLDLDSGSTTTDQGVQIQSLATIVKPIAGRTIAFEMRAALRDQGAAATPQLGTLFFAGLSEMDTTFFAAGANSSANHVGFEMNALTQAGTGGTAGSVNFYGEKAGVRNTAAADVGLNVQALTANTFVKYGFVIDGVTNTKVFINGVYTADVIPTANVPIVAMALTVCCLTEVTNRPLLRVDWIRCASVPGDAN